MFLQNNHCNYKNLKIDKNNLLILFKNNFIADQLSAYEINKLFFSNLNNFLNSQNLLNADLNKFNDEN